MEAGRIGSPNIFDATLRCYKEGKFNFLMTQISFPQPLPFHSPFFLSPPPLFPPLFFISSFCSLSCQINPPSSSSTHPLCSFFLSFFIRTVSCNFLFIFYFFALSLHHCFLFPDITPSSLSLRVHFLSPSLLSYRSDYLLIFLLAPPGPFMFIFRLPPPASSPLVSPIAVPSMFLFLDQFFFSSLAYIVLLSVCWATATNP